jgi:hypothetical protein
MSESVTPSGPYIGGLDCSPQAQADRRRRLIELEGIYYGGAASISDRNRSVSFRGRGDLAGILAALRREIAICDGCPLRRRRVFYVSQVKDL